MSNNPEGVLFGIVIPTIVGLLIVFGIIQLIRRSLKKFERQQEEEYQKNKKLIIQKLGGTKIVVRIVKSDGGRTPVETKVISELIQCGVEVIRIRPERVACFSEGTNDATLPDNCHYCLCGTVVVKDRSQGNLLYKSKIDLCILNSEKRVIAAYYYNGNHLDLEEDVSFALVLGLARSMK